MMDDVGKKREKAIYMTGEEFVGIRTALGKTQTELAELLDYTSISISNFENDETRIPKPLALLMRAVASGKVKLK
jgi:transcriptional regulator with XRE-family HTH domain